MGQWSNVAAFQRQPKPWVARVSAFTLTAEVMVVDPSGPFSANSGLMLGTEIAETGRQRTCSRRTTGGTTRAVRTRSGMRYNNGLDDMTLAEDEAMAN